MAKRGRPKKIKVVQGRSEFEDEYIETRGEPYSEVNYTPLLEDIVEDQRELNTYRNSMVDLDNISFEDSGAKLIPISYHVGWTYAFKRNTSPVQITRVLMRKDYPEFSKGDKPSLHGEADHTVEEVDALVKGEQNDPRVLALDAFKSAGNADKLIAAVKDQSCPQLKDLYKDLLSFSIVMFDENKVYVDKNTMANVKNITIALGIVVVCKDGLYEATIIIDRQHLGYDA